MGKQRIVKFQAAKASYIFRYNMIQDSCAAKPLFLN